jgi:hypothetical protein
MGGKPRQRVSNGNQLRSASHRTIKILYLLGHQYVLQCNFNESSLSEKKTIVSLQYESKKQVTHQRRYGRIALLSGEPASLRHGDRAQMGGKPRQRVSNGNQLRITSHRTLTILYLLGHQHVLQCNFNNNSFSEKKKKKQ